MACRIEVEEPYQRRSISFKEVRQMDEKAQLIIEGKTYELPILTGSEGEKAIDISTLRQKNGFITLDVGLGKGRRTGLPCHCLIRQRSPYYGNCE